jgi:hypothetical protein
MPDVAYACSTCGVAKATTWLSEIAELIPAARDVAHRQSRRSAGGAANKPGSSPPIDFDITERLDEIQNTLTTWLRVIEHERGPQTASALPASRLVPDPVALAARALSGHLEWVRHKPWADEFLDDVVTAARRLAGIINGPTPGRYAGPCSVVDDEGQTCGEDVTARPGSNVGTCRACGAEYDVDEQQAWMRRQIEDQLARSVVIAGVLLQLGFPIGYSTIASYAKKGQLIAHGQEVGHDGKEHPLYRIGDVLDLRMATRTKGRLASRGSQS